MSLQSPHKDLSNRLLALKKAVDDANNNLAKYEGQRDFVLAELKKLGFNSIKEAEAHVLKQEKEQDKLGKMLNEQLAEIEERYANIIG